MTYWTVWHMFILLCQFSAEYKFRMNSNRTNQEVTDIISDDEEFAQWVQCVDCHKWRELEEDECIYKVNRLTWTCDKRFEMCCESPEMKGRWWNAKCTYQDYQPGDLIAVKVDGMPVFSYSIIQVEELTIYG